MEEKEKAKVEEKKQYKRYRLREHYTCIDSQVSLQKSDIVEVLDDQQQNMWLVRHCTDTQQVFFYILFFSAFMVILDHWFKAKIHYTSFPVASP